MSLTDSSSDWIWAYLSGDAISSDSVSANINQHSKYGTTTLNLQDAAGGSSSNPFFNTVATTTSSGSTSGSGVAPQTTEKYKNILMAHAIMAPAAFVLLFPVGAMGIRALSFPGLVFIHAGWMIFTLGVVIAALSLGIWMAVVTKQIETTHAIVGLVVFGSLFAQPASGLAHHLLYKKQGRPNIATLPHVFWGRAVVTLGIINGGLGLQLSGNTKKGEIAYGVLAGIMWVLWMSVILLSFLKTRRNTGSENIDGGEKLVGNRSGLQKGQVKPGQARYSESVSQRESPIANYFMERRQETTHL